MMLVSRVSRRQMKKTVAIISTHRVMVVVWRKPTRYGKDVRHFSGFTRFARVDCCSGWRICGSVTTYIKVVQAHQRWEERGGEMDADLIRQGSRSPCTSLRTIVWIRQRRWLLMCRSDVASVLGTAYSHREEKKRRSPGKGLKLSDGAKSS